MAIVKTLRGYQADLYRRLNRARNNGKDAVMLLPTGAGKTAIARNVLRQADRWFVSFNKNLRRCIVLHSFTRTVTIKGEKPTPLGVGWIA